MHKEFARICESVSNQFRRLGLEGEAAFNAVAYQYTLCFPQPLSSLPKVVKEKWYVAYEQIEKSPSAVELLKRFVTQDPSGNWLPEWYQFFIGRRYRSDSGKFFTPRPIAAAMARLLPYSENPVIMDPTCGGGTFLAQASYVWRHGHCTLVANDIEASLVELTMLVLYLCSPREHTKYFSSVNIFNPTAELTRWYGKVDYILANPPFSLKIEDGQFDSGLFEAGYRNSDALFIDIALKLIRPGGRLVCLLPHSVIANKEFTLFRSIVENSWFVLGVICLPEGSFNLTAGTTTRADIVILERKSERDSKRPEKMVFASVPSIGIPLSRTAKTPTPNELEKVLATPEIQAVLHI